MSKHLIYNPEMECMDVEQRRELQLQRLQKTVRLEYDNVPVYRERMDAKGIKPEDIRRLIAFRNNPSDESWIGG